MTRSLNCLMVFSSFVLSTATFAVTAGTEIGNGIWKNRNPFNPMMAHQQQQQQEQQQVQQQQQQQEQQQGQQQEERKKSKPRPKRYASSVRIDCWDLSGTHLWVDHTPKGIVGNILPANSSRVQKSYALSVAKYNSTYIYYQQYSHRYFRLEYDIRNPWSSRLEIREKPSTSKPRGWAGPLNLSLVLECRSYSIKP